MSDFPASRAAGELPVDRRPSRQMRLSAPIRVILLAALLATCWGLPYNVGPEIIGTHSFYVPLLLAAYWFGSLGAMLTGIAGAVLAGPLLPLDPATGEAQLGTLWFSRALSFQLIGQLAAWFFARPRGEAALERSRRRVTTVNARLSHEITQGETDRGEAIERIRGLVEDPQAIRIVFQPLVNLKTYQPFAMEALSRFALEPRRGPDKWFEEAWTVGQGIELELVAVKRAIAYMDRLPEGCLLAVNVSPDTVIAAEFGDLVTELPVDRLVLELTEHSRIDEYPAVKEALRVFREEGGQLAIDDTGAGYATFRHVLELVPDIIKLDVELTRRVESDSALQALTQSMVRLGLELEAVIVAEGVETEEQLEALRELGVQYAQGFYLSKPAPIRIPEASPPPASLSLADARAESYGLLREISSGRQESSPRAPK